jgi:1,4-alpha-glucan branching enzyme
MSDPWLNPFKDVIDRRIAKSLLKEKLLVGNGTLCDFAMGHYYYGLHRDKDSWVFREWAPNAKSIFVIGVFTDWKEKEEFMMTRINPMGNWEVFMPTGWFRMKRLKYSMPRYGNLKKTINGVINILLLRLLLR